MLEPWRKGIVLDIVQETASTRRYLIQVPEVKKFDFKPGQFVTLDLPISEKRNKRWRSYSIASPPNDTNIFELVIVLLEGGAGSTYIFNEVKTSSELMLRGPQGVFTLPDVLDRDIFFICTGTGIAPFRSMLYYIKHQSIAHKNLYLVFGTRKISDCLYMTEMQQLQYEIENYHYLTTFSREDAANLRKGYVHAVYEEILADIKPPAYFYLCGWKNMIDEARSRILALGYDRKDIHLELYG